MTPSTHTSIRVPKYRTRSTENCARFYFKTENFIVLLSNEKTDLVNLPTLPQINAVHHTEQFLPPLPFIPTGKIDAYSVDVGAFYQMFKEVKHRSVKPNITEKHAKYVNDTTFTFIGDFFGGIMYRLSSLYTWVIGVLCSVFMPIVYVLVGVLLFIILIRTCFYGTLENCHLECGPFSKKGI